MNAKSEQVSGAIFLIGLGLLWITGWWFPGILFAIGASTMATAISNHRPWTGATGALWLFGLGFIFWLHLPWGIILLLIGLSILSSSQCKDEFFDEKSKNDHKYKNDDIDFV